MNLFELKEAVDKAVMLAVEYGERADSITVSVQVDINKESAWSDNVELVYDGDCQASGCVIVGLAHNKPLNVRKAKHSEDDKKHDCPFCQHLAFCVCE